MVSPSVLKFTSRCDLACDYRYVFGDDAWRALARTMPEHILDATAARIAEHAVSHATSTVWVVLHGGERCLRAPNASTRGVSAPDGPAAGGIGVKLSLQTMAPLLDEPMLAVMRRHRIRIGTSLGGTAEMHDRHRRRCNGRGSHSSTTRALRRSA